MKSPDPSQGRKRTWTLVLRAVFGIAALGFLLSRLDLNEVIQGLSNLAWGGVLLALLAQALGKLVWAARWRDILRVNGVERGLVHLVALLMIGLFFNSFLPTSMGGDVVRGHFSGAGQQKTRAYAVVIVERVLGLITLAVLVALSSIVMLVAPVPHMPQNLLIALGLSGLAVLVMGVTTFTWKGWRVWLQTKTESKPWLHRMVTDLGRGFDLFSLAQGRRVRIGLTSLGVQLVGVIFFYGCALAVGLEVPFLVLCLIVPAAVLASMLPISINGLGLREGALVGLLAAYGVPANTAGSFAFLALIIASAVALVGGVIYIFYRQPLTESSHA